MQVTVQVQGASEIARAMRELPKRVDRKILNAGLLAGARLVRDEARDRAPTLQVPDPRWTRGAIRRAIQSVSIAASRAQYAGEVIVRVRKLTKRQISAFKRRQARRGQKVAGKLNPSDAYYWTFLEFGTAKMRAQSFLRPAFEGRKQQGVDAAIKVFREKVQLEIEKLGRTTA